MLGPDEETKSLAWRRQIVRCLGSSLLRLRRNRFRIRRHKDRRASRKIGAERRFDTRFRKSEYLRVVLGNGLVNATHGVEVTGSGTCSGGAQIYVQIPAYRDSELPATLMDLYAKADASDELRVRVLWQHGATEQLPKAVCDLPGLELVAIPCEKSRGCNWARNQLQQEWRGERYSLLLDSHHRFKPGWDRMLVQMYEGLRRDGVTKPILTSYLPSYRPAHDPGERKRRPYKIYPLGREQGLLTRLTSYPILGYRQLERPVPADFVSLHFLFSAGKFNQEVPFDPAIYFFGDEVLTSVRAYTHGYDLFHPHMVVGWHCFDRTSRIPHWSDHKEWRNQHARSLAIMRRIFRGKYQGEFGVGERRGVREYEEYALLTLAEDSWHEAVYTH